jgi:predicted DNA-binding transcriptional regulator YafY
LPPRIKENLDELSKIIGKVTLPNKDYSKFGGIIEELTTAAIKRRTVSMRYESLSSSQNEVRLFDSYNIYLDPDGATLKAIGFDCRNNRVSPFSLDRIRSIKITREIFTCPPDFDLRRFLTENCFNGIPGEPVTARLKVKGVTASVFVARQFPRRKKSFP